MIFLSKQQHEYMISILNENEELKNRILKVALPVKDNYEYNMDDDLEIEFYDFLQDKQVEVGFDKNYDPNNDWERIQVLMDEVYSQTNPQ